MMRREEEMDFFCLYDEEVVFAVVYLVMMRRVILRLLKITKMSLKTVLSEKRLHRAHFIPAIASASAVFSKSCLDDKTNHLKNYIFRSTRHNIVMYD
jgi:hypothetical protein